MNRESAAAFVVGIRSLTFHAASGVVTVAAMLLYPLILSPGWLVWAILRRYILVQLWLLKAICGLSHRVEGLENVPDGPCILASRHEAMWETLYLPLIFGNPAVLLKKEILGYPVFGPVARKLGYIGVDRSGALDQIRETMVQAQKVAEQGRRVLIFPSGSRKPEFRGRVQSGAAVLYRMLNLPVVPIVLDSGSYWPLNDWRRYPGVITVRVLAPIPPGQPSRDYLERLQSDLSQPVVPQAPHVAPTRAVPTGAEPTVNRTLRSSEPPH